jgi:hypothetical protein
MKQANAFTAYITVPKTVIATQPKLSTLTISPVGNVITIEQFAEWDKQ